MINFKREHGWLAREVVYFEETGSTNVDAFGLAAKGSGHGTLVIADSQTGGKGRRGACIGRQCTSRVIHHLGSSLRAC